MNKKILSGLLLAIVCSAAFFSCKKTTVNNTDLTLNYFPIKYGHYVTYAVDSIYYFSTSGSDTGVTAWRYEVKSQMKYAVTDTFRDNNNVLSYIMNVYSRPYDGGIWKGTSVIEITETPTTVTNLLAPVTTSLFYTQDRTQYVKLMFPIYNGYTWQGNQNAQVNDPTFTYLANWNYTYSNFHLSYFNGQINFDNTVTVDEDNENVNYTNIDTGVAGYRTFAREVYAYNVGMVYKEWTHYTWNASNTNAWNGYTVIMRAIDYN